MSSHRPFTRSDSTAAGGDGNLRSPEPLFPFAEEVEIVGHIIDSLILPKVLDEIITLGGRFQIDDVQIGNRRNDPSYARLQVSAETPELLDQILNEIGQHGAVPVNQVDCRVVEADIDGAFPEGFYATTNQDTEIRLDGTWIPVAKQEMDCGIVVDVEAATAECVAMSDVRRGQMIVVGRAGTRVHPLERDTSSHGAFGFMASAVSSEKPKGVTVREIAGAMRRARDGQGKILVVAGPAVVHTGSREYLSHLIRHGYVNVLFAGNALATHDIEQSFFGTSLGISMQHGGGTDEGHEHHLRSINRIRRLGSISNAVRQGVLTSGIMYECVQNHVPFLLAGSIRDDGPLPDVITDTIEAQRKMRDMIEGVTFCLMIATTLHSIAVGNLLPARVKVVCADINPATVTKLTDRGSFQTIGLVTDVEPFLRILVQELNPPPAT
ncbi:MAG: TIGR00300 family protein [Planctomycetaceae bacterium]|nr:TIGR00300 family protein [Planctomycetaceae bacterium]